MQQVAAERQRDAAGWDVLDLSLAEASQVRPVEAAMGTGAG